jgi:hypothetical protein
MTTSHKSADCIAEVARLNTGSSQSPAEAWQDYQNLIARMSPNLSTGDAEEMFYLMMLEMYNRVGFMEDVERIYNTVMARNYNW